MYTRKLRSPFRRAVLSLSPPSFPPAHDETAKWYYYRFAKYSRGTFVHLRTQPVSTRYARAYRVQFGPTVARATTAVIIRKTRYEHLGRSPVLGGPLRRQDRFGPSTGRRRPSFRSRIDDEHGKKEGGETEFGKKFNAVEKSIIVFTELWT